MSKKFLFYFILWILLQALVEVNCQMTPFKPPVLYKHTATLIDNKLYILGEGVLNGKSFEKEFFYLDVSVPFNTQNLLWQDLSNINVIPTHNSATSVRGGANNDTLILYGGITNDQTMTLVYTFDPQSNSWSIPKIMGVNNIRKSRLTGVIHDGKMYLWSGTNNPDNYEYMNDMLILDTINLSWGKGSLVNAPTPRDYYGATLLPNSNIIYIGGNNDKTFSGNAETLNIVSGNALTLSEVYIYDTINDNWSTKITSGTIPSNRAGFSTVLGLDGQRIIIFGGFFINPGYLDTTLYELDIINFVWTVPEVTGKIPNPRVWHKANVIGKYMVISFGIGYDNSIASDILLLDISNNKEYVWTTTFDPSIPNNNVTISLLPPPSSSHSPLPSSSTISNTTPAIAGAIVGSLFGGILFSFGVFFLYKWNKNKRKQGNQENQAGYVIPIHGNENFNNYDQEGTLTSTKRNVHNSGQGTMLTMLRNIVVNKTSRNEAMTTPVPVIDRNYRQEMPSDENTTNHEQIIPVPEDNRNYNHGQEITTSFIDDKLQIFKDEILQAVKQEINQNVKNQ
ncbi:hypothetical protein C1645_739820 [Glomus cerebriforme]|uniref:Galactose oxidase n=1 Tax=Glomus cerebriforme TaxID=658196 RepID=A0A397STC5_9GLOM|nr:hypothetical protein C1645_739820 [Glomus cerebriforme]